MLHDFAIEIVDLVLTYYDKTRDDLLTSVRQHSLSAESRRKRDLIYALALNDIPHLIASSTMVLQWNLLTDDAVTQALQTAGLVVPSPFDRATAEATLVAAGVTPQQCLLVQPVAPQAPQAAPLPAFKSPPPLPQHQSEDIRSFLDRIHGYLRVTPSCSTNDHRFQLLYATVRPEVADYLGTIIVPGMSTFDTVCESLITRFGRSPMDAMHQFRNAVKQRGESFVAFSTRLSKLYLEVLGHTGVPIPQPIQEAVRQGIYSHLPTFLSTSCYNFARLELIREPRIPLLDLFSRIDTFVATNPRFQSWPNNMSNDKQRGFSQTKPHSGEYKPAANHTGFRRPDSTDPRSGRSSKPVTCYNCNQPGHLQSNCRQPPKNGNGSE